MCFHSDLLMSFVLSQEIGWEERQQNDLYCVDWEPSAWCVSLIYESFAFRIQYKSSLSFQYRVVAIVARVDIVRIENLCRDRHFQTVWVMVVPTRIKGGDMMSARMPVWCTIDFFSVQNPPYLTPLVLLAVYPVIHYSSGSCCFISMHISYVSLGWKLSRVAAVVCSRCRMLSYCSPALPTRDPRGHSTEDSYRDSSSPQNLPQIWMPMLPLIASFCA